MSAEYGWRSGRAIAFCVLAAAVGLAGGSPTAQAGTATMSVSFDDHFIEPDKGTQRDSFLYRAKAGERNGAVVEMGRSEVRVRDRVAVRAGPGCVQSGARVARCPIAPLRRPRRSWMLIVEADVVAGDGDDRLSASAIPRPGRFLGLSGGSGDDTLVMRAWRGRRSTNVVGNAYGGAGNDTLLGGPGRDILYGEAGDDLLQARGGGDILTGGDGRDTLQGGRGDDVLTGDETETGAVAADDVLDGGPGSDTVSYEGPGPLIVDLSDPGPDGHTNERDTLNAIENVRGGEGPNTLIGDGGANRLGTTRSAAEVASVADQGATSSSAATATIVSRI